MDGILEKRIREYMKRIAPELQDEHGEVFPQDLARAAARELADDPNTWLKDENHPVWTIAYQEA